LRRATVNAAREPLHGDIELDDTWIGGPQAGLKGSRQLKDRRAVPLVGAVERRDDHSGRLPLFVPPGFTAAPQHALPRENNAAGSTLYSDGLGAFAGLKAAGYRHVALKQPLRSALRKGRYLGRAPRGSCCRQPPELADWDPPRRQPRSAPGVPR